MDEKITIIKRLRDETGININKIKQALDFCGNEDLTKIFLKLKYSSVVRYKIINGEKVRFSDNDYLLLAKEIQSK